MSDDKEMIFLLIGIREWPLKQIYPQNIGLPSTSTVEIILP